MPRDDNMAASLIQRVARQARLTFRPPGSTAATSSGGGGGGDGPRSVEDLERLRELLGEVRAEDLRLSPRGPSAVPGSPSQPPVSYMHICETESFSMGVFVLRAGACIPLHDHPGMNGLLKVLYGTLRIACLDTLPPEDGADPGPPPPPPSSSQGHRQHPHHHRHRRHRALLRSHRLYTPSSAPCLLSPDSNNLHQIDAVGAGPAAFLDILAPPYDPEHGRDCHYYRLLDDRQGLLLLAPPSPDQDPDPGVGLPKELWLQETPQAPDFWCGGEPYPGPQVSP